MTRSGVLATSSKICRALTVLAPDICIGASWAAASPESESIAAKTISTVWSFCMVASPSGCSAGAHGREESIYFLMQAIRPVRQLARCAQHIVGEMAGFARRFAHAADIL